MAPWPLRVALTALVLLGPAGPVRSQEPPSPLSQTVVAVRFEVEGRPDESPSLAGLSAVRVGDPLRSEDVRSTIARLDGLGLYEGVSASAGYVAGGVEVVFHLDPRHPVTDLAVEGDTGLPSGDLRRLLQQRYGGVPTTTRASVVEATATQILNDEGYLAARVDSRLELTHDPDAATLVLEVRAGPRALIRTAEVRGDSPRSPSAILREASAEAGRPFRRREIETALTAIEEDFRGRGYYEAQLTLQATPGPEGVDIVVGVDTGPIVEVRVVPESALPGSLDTLVPIRSIGSADQDLLEDSRVRIERALRAQGYWKASAPFTRSLQEDGDLLVITFTIDRGPRYYVEGIEIADGLTLPAARILSLIGLSPGDVFDEDRFLVGLTLVADEYRRAGFYAVKAEPTYSEVDGGASATRAAVVLYPTITEGPAGRVVAVDVDREGEPLIAEADVRAAMASRPGQPYVESMAAGDQLAIRNLYLDRGFFGTAVLVRPTFDEDGRAVTLNVQITEGVRVFIADISVVGNGQISTGAILEEMRLETGQPAGAAELDEARRRLVEMGVFRRVSVSLADRAADETQGHLIVNVVEAPATTVGIGFGLEGGRYPRRTATGIDDRIELAPRGFFEVSRRNLGGRNRILSFFTRVGLRRSRAGTLEELVSEDPGGFGFTEYRVTGTFRERRAFGTEADLLIGVTSEQGRRTNFNFVRQRANAEVLRSLSPTVNVTARYGLEFSRLFDEQIDEEDRPLIDRLFPEVRLSIVGLGAAWDRRDSPIEPTLGALVTADVEMAARSIGSEVGYVKGFFQGALYRRLDPAGLTVLAGRAMFGIARGFSRAVTVPGRLGEETVEDLPASQRFFAGGATTVRGFQLDRLGVEEIIRPNGLSVGGNGVLVANLELRRYVTRLLGRSFGVVAFVDAGNVFRRANDINFVDLRSAVGFGARYDSPLGPLRLDFGFKVRPRTIYGARERGWEYHLSIGEAF